MAFITIESLSQIDAQSKEKKFVFERVSSRAGSSFLGVIRNRVDDAGKFAHNTAQIAWRLEWSPSHVLVAGSILSLDAPNSDLDWYLQ